MISTALFKREMKSGWKLLLIFMAVLTMYGVMIVAMFDPKYSDSLNSIVQSMPGLMALFGMDKVGSSLTQFIANYLYGFLLQVFPLIFILIMANRLIARYVDSGSMAYLLATPVKRIRIALTQLLFLCLCVVLLVVYFTLLIILTGEAMFPGQLYIRRFLLLNLGLLGLLTFYDGMCFFASAVFNETKKSYAAGAGPAVAFLLIQMLSNAGDKFSGLKYATPLTLFDTGGILSGDPGSVPCFIILYAAGIILFVAGIMSFIRRDLPV
jgi:ABC-2 type transport system permease protein